MVNFVIVESPFAPKGNTPEAKAVSLARNLAYVRAAMNDVFARGGVPYASHALYTQPGVLDDTIPQERAKGIEAGFVLAHALWDAARALPSVYSFRREFFIDRGYSSGMVLGEKDAIAKGQPHEVRHLDPDFWSVEKDGGWVLTPAGELVQLSKNDLWR